jgi:hypothetical protein
LEAPKWSIVILLAVFSACSVVPPPAQTAGPPKAESDRPDGKGDPDGTTCRSPQPIPGSRLPGPEVCKLNSEWALLRKNRQDISMDGQHIIADPKGGNLAPMNCRAMGGGSTSTGGTMVCQ